MDIVIIGSGVAAGTIVSAIESKSLGSVTAVVDPLPKATEWVERLRTQGRLYEDIAALNPLDHFDVACVAVPTPIHFAVLDSLIRSPCCPQLILSEKPLTSSAAEASNLLAAAEQKGIDLRMLLHFSVAPEVRWLREHLADLSRELGMLLSVQSSFTDDYADTGLAEAQERLQTPWLDSGVNSLSVVLQLLDITRVTSVQRDWTTEAFAFFAGASGEQVQIKTSWRGGQRDKRTELFFERGQIVLNHTKQSVAIGGVIQYQAPGDDRTGTRYGTLMEKHLTEGNWGQDDARLQQETLYWLHAADQSKWATRDKE